MAFILTFITDQGLSSWTFHVSISSSIIDIIVLVSISWDTVSHLRKNGDPIRWVLTTKVRYNSVITTILLDVAHVCFLFVDFTLYPFNSVNCNRESDSFSGHRDSFRWIVEPGGPPARRRRIHRHSVDFREGEKGTGGVGSPGHCRQERWTPAVCKLEGWAFFSRN